MTSNKAGIIHDHNRDLLVTKIMCKDLPDNDWGEFRCRRVVDLSSDVRYNTGKEVQRHLTSLCYQFEQYFGITIIWLIFLEKILAFNRFSYADKLAIS